MGTVVCRVLRSDLCFKGLTCSENGYHCSPGPLS